MASMNTVCITGHLGKDPEIRSTSGGTTVMQFNLAVSERRKINGEWDDYTHWVPVTMFGSRADSVSKFLHKGSKVGITGKLNYSQWQNKDGENRHKLEVVANEIELLTPKNQGSHPSESVPQQQSMAAPVVDASIYDTSIPF